MALVNTSYIKCAVTECTAKPNFALKIEGRGRGGGPYTITILTCGEHIDEADTFAKTEYPNFARELFDNPFWLEREQRKEEQKKLQEQAGTDFLHYLERSGK